MNAVAGQANFFDPAALADPFVYYRDALAHGPVREVASGMLVSFAYDLCTAALSETALFSSNFKGPLASGMRRAVRKELALAFGELSRRLTGIVLAEGFVPRWSPNASLRGLTALPILCGRRS